jgi:putative peptidoglycan lipid II flippase
MNEFIEYVSVAARYVLFWSIPAIALIIVLRAHIVRVVLGSGAFDWTDTRLTAAVFALLSISLAAQGLTLLLTRAYYAAGRTFVPFFVASASSVATISIATILLHLMQDETVLRFFENSMRLEDVPGISILALALAYTGVSIAGVLVLASHFERRFGGLLARIRSSLWQGTLAAVSAGIIAYAVLVLTGPLTLSSTLLSVFLKGLGGGVAGIAGAAAVHWLMGNREYLETTSVVRDKLWRTQAPVPAPLSSAEEIGPTNP